MRRRVELNCKRELGDDLLLFPKPLFLLLPPPSPSKKWYQKTLSGLINKKAIAPAAVAGILGAVLVQQKIPQKTWDKMKGLWSGKVSVRKEEREREV